MKALMNRLLSRWRSGTLDKDAPIDAGAPILLMVGSLEGCTKKDALAYAKGLAERHITSPELAAIRVHEDRFHNRYLYEVHEGGAGRSILAALLPALREKGKVRIALTNKRAVQIEDPYGEVYSLIAPLSAEDLAMARAEVAEPEVQTLDGEHAADMAHEDALEEAELVPLERVHDYQGKEKLTKLYNEGQNMPGVSAAILILAISCFMATGAFYTLVQGGAFESDPVLTPIKAGHLSDDRNNPTWQLGRARAEADAQGTTIQALRKDSKGWSWELAQ